MRPSTSTLLLGLGLASSALAHSEHAEVVEGATYAEIHMAQEHHMVSITQVVTAVTPLATSCGPEQGPCVGEGGHSPPVAERPSRGRCSHHVVEC